MTNCPCCRKKGIFPRKEDLEKLCRRHLLALYCAVLLLDLRRGDNAILEAELRIRKEQEE